MATVERLDVHVYKVPTDFPESDGTIEWDSTTMVLVEARSGSCCGIGYTYADEATASVIGEKLTSRVVGKDVNAVSSAFVDMTVAIRNLGRPGIAAMAVSAVDSALWDLKARTLGVSLSSLLGAARASVEIYGSGGFCSYPIERLRAQLGGWVSSGIRRVKMKIGRDPSRDLERVRAARDAIGDAALFVDANGAYSRKQALSFADAFAETGVAWFEEPVTSDDLEGLRLLVDRAPAVMDIAAGEYGYDLTYFRRMLAAGAVDILQADMTRCGGVTGLMQVAALCESHHVPLSCHCAPSLHAHVASALPNVAHIEYFHDHARIESMLFDGVLAPKNGALHPERSKPGNGLSLKKADAARFAA